ncbi:MAG: hypothetical protein SGI89_10305 [bacterium]|nr:hypothetical protein [bacterium]
MKKLFLLCPIYIYLVSISYGQLTLSSVEFLNNQRELTFTNPVTNSSETRKTGLCIGKIDASRLSSGIYFYSVNIDGEGKKFRHDQKNNAC